MLKVNGKVITHENKKYKQDNDCHWYVIHKDDVKLFETLLEKEDYDEFEDRFEMGRTGGAMDGLDDEI